MLKTEQTDVVIVGGGSAGAFMAWRLAEQGCRTIVVESQKRGRQGAHIGIFHMDEIRFAQFSIPLPQGDERLGYHATGRAWPPDGDRAKTVDYAFYVMEMPLFIGRIQGYAESAGAILRFETAYKAPIVEDGRIRGIEVERSGETVRIEAPIVVDASGVDAVVRTSLPPELGLETDAIAPKDFLYVFLQYWEDVDRDLPEGLNFYPFHKAFINPGYGEGGRIVGIGQPASLERAKAVQKSFLTERFPHATYRLARTAWGRTPFRRPPFSLVSDGFITVGDAAYMTKPFSGEGVTSGFTACAIAVDVIRAALAAGDVSRNRLWPLNVRYFRDQGAKFAALLAQLPAAAELPRQDVNYLFSKDTVFASDDFEAMNKDFEVKMGPARMASTAAKLIWGRLSGALSAQGLAALVAATRTASRVRGHYEAFPESAEGFDAWQAAAEQIWQQG